MKVIRRLFPLSISMPADFRIYGIGIREQMRPGIVHRPHGGKHYLLIYFHTPVVINSEKANLMPSGTMVIWAPGQEQRYGNSNAAWNHTWIAMDGVLVRKKLRELNLPVNAPIPGIIESSLVDNFLTALFRELADHALPDAVILRNTLESFLRSLRRAINGPARRAPIPQKFRMLRRLIDDQFDRSISLDDLAKRIHVSRWHFCREFKKHFGTSPIEYMLRLRMQHAANLLRDPDLNISDIGRQCGYNDLFHFSKLFRKHHGLSPRHMRNQLWPRAPSG
jgi:AraC family transcriptional regulator, arabinose operon regulatory protein